MPKFIDLTGEKIGGFVVIGIDHAYNGKGKKWNCLCSCGSITSIRGDELKRGQKYCKNCVPRGRPTHNLSKLPEYHIWSAIKQRCYNAGCSAYVHYGGRGIKMYDGWINSFEKFIKDVGRRPGDDYTIERINNNGGYTPSNVRWATQKEQCRNFGRNVILDAFGVKKCISEWAEIYGVSHDTISRRLKRGYPVELAISSPYKPNKKMVLIEGNWMSMRAAEKHLGLGGGVISYRLKRGYSMQESVSPHQPQKK